METKISTSNLFFLPFFFHATFLYNAYHHNHHHVQRKKKSSVKPTTKVYFLCRRDDRERKPNKGNVCSLLQSSHKVSKLQADAHWMDWQDWKDALLLLLLFVSSLPLGNYHHTIITPTPAVMEFYLPLCVFFFVWGYEQKEIKTCGLVHNIMMIHNTRMTTSTENNYRNPKKWQMLKIFRLEGYTKWWWVLHENLKKQESGEKNEKNEPLRYI